MYTCLYTQINATAVYLITGNTFLAYSVNVTHVLLLYNVLLPETIHYNYSFMVMSFITRDVNRVPCTWVP